MLWKAPLGAVLRAFCPCGLVRQALNYILRGVRIGADRVKITLFFRGAERVHVPTVRYFVHLAKPLDSPLHSFCNDFLLLQGLETEITTEFCAAGSCYKAIAAKSRVHVKADQVWLPKGPKMLWGNHFDEMRLANS